MYTSDTDTSLRTGMRYLTASLIIAVAAAVYGLFSHGVYSYYMTYAFMIPLLGGALPHLLAATRREDAADGEEQVGAAENLAAKDTQLAIITTLTAGSLLKGVLDIYGTTNRLLIAYPAAAALMLAAALTVLIKHGGNPFRIFKKIF